VARKEHHCIECRETIAAGTRYEYASGIWDGSASSFKTCLDCVEIRNHFACSSGWEYGSVWAQLKESFFPAMTAGGQCMAGLSPAAKQRLIDKRMEWYFAHDEIDDSAWKDWPKNKDVQRKRYVMPDAEEKDDYYSTPEFYWPRRLKEEEWMRAYEEQEKKK